ncbi:hypothetical protein [Pseudomonas indica]|uniref:hypothetical protein n=1 Tax=Pseudomonas indica TaxID=137658 RepID=UPI003FCF1792
MTWLALAPSSARVVAVLIGGALLMGIGAGLVWWGLSPRIDRQADRAANAEQQLSAAQQMIDLQGNVLAEQQRQLGAITEIEREMRRLGQTITRTAAEQSAAIEELRANDQIVAEWLRGAVPPALGRLYARPETTDPAAYHGPSGMRPDPVPPAGTPGTAHQ